jgi:hypothetical protein
MNRSIRALESLVGIALLLAFAAAPVYAQAVAKQKVVVHLTHDTDDLRAVKMAVHLAGKMHEMGADGTLLLDLEGGRLADSRLPGDLIWGHGEPISGS